MDVAQKLFREEVVSRRFGRLQGDVLIVVPRSWLAVSFVLFVVVACGLLVAFSVRYSRYTSVAGMVQPDRGVANLLAVRAGMISGVQVRIGDQVKAGQALIMVRSYEDLIAGGSAGDRSREVLPVQSTNIATHPSAAFQENCAQVNGVIAEMAGLQSRVDGLVGQTEMQNSLVKLGESQINDAQVLFAQGFLSKQDLQDREATLLQWRQHLSQLRSSASSKRASLAKLGEALVDLRTAKCAQSVSLANVQSGVSEKWIDGEHTSGYVLRSPIAGRVTSLDARVGQSASPGDQLLQVVPDGSRLEAELSVPSGNIGSIRKGQRVRIALDAFPYQRYGTILGVISSVAQSSVARSSGQGGVTFVYPVRVALSQDWVAIEGRREPLMTGMSLTGRIMVEHASLWEWLFKPMFVNSR